jgi:hypothetical protein
MPGTTTLAAGIMAALSVSVLIAQSTDNEPLPPAMHFCAQHCLTFTLENGQYTNYTNLPGQQNEKRVFRIERFTRESVIIHRTDYGSFPGSGVYTGKMSDDGNSLSGNGWKITWGAALNSIPGSDEERSQIAARQRQTNPSVNPAPPAPYMPHMSEPAAAMAEVKFDWSGDWQGYFDGPMLPRAIRVTQMGDTLTAEDLFYEQLTPVGKPFFRGMYTSGARFMVELAVYAGLAGLVMKVPQGWQPAELVIGDPDHFRIGNHPPFERIARPKPGDVSCDATNRFHTYAKGAFVRGNLQLGLKNYEQAACWFYIASKLGNYDAMSNLGYMYENGFGVERDYETALKFYTTSAEQGSINGAHNAVLIYEKGLGVPKNPEQAQVWRAKEARMRTDKSARQRAEAIEDQKQEQGMELLGLLGRVAASVVAQAGLESPLCDWNTEHQSAQDIRHKKDILRADGLMCKDGELVSAPK